MTVKDNQAGLKSLIEAVPEPPSFTDDPVLLRSASRQRSSGIRGVAALRSGVLW